MTYNNNNYYEPEDDDYSYQNDIQERAAELIKSDKSYDYTDKVNFGEAIQQMSDADQETVRDYIEQKDWAKLGQKLACMSMAYQENLAEYIIENGK